MRTVQGRSLPETADELLAPEMRPVLLIIDVQNDFADPDGHFARAGSDVSDIQSALPSISGLISGARASGLPVNLGGSLPIKGVIPFFLVMVMLAGLILIWVFPALATWLPRTMAQ